MFECLNWGRSTMYGKSSEDPTMRAVTDPREAIALAWRSIVPDVWPQTEAQTSLAMKKIRMAAANLKLGMQAMPGVVVVIAILNCMWTPWPLAAAWAAGTIFMWYLSWQVFRGLEARPNTAGTRADVLKIFAATGGFVLALGAQGILFWAPNDPSNQMTVILILLACTLASAITAAWLPLSLLQIVCYVSVVTAMLISTQTVVNVALGILAIFFGIFLLGMISNLHAYSVRLLTLEDHKDALIEQLRASNRAKSDFLANMSHELRTPMNAILGFSEVIKDELMGPNHQPLYRSYAKDIHTSGAHLLGLINDILDLSKIEAGKFELKESEVDVFEIVEDTKRIISLKAAQKGVALINQIPPGLIVWADAAALRQVSLNLASNALKFTPSGGSIRTFLEIIDGKFTFATQDTGCGIRPEDLTRVFENFGQGRHDVASAEKGTGLGLPIVRGLVRAHGGDVTIESTLGKGTTVLVTIGQERVRHVPGVARLDVA
jgi:two-component system, cell cycle sensor histidine kinase PleC